jgi:predicted Zn-dependent protease
MVIELAKDNKLVDATAACENAIKLDPTMAGTCRRNIGITLYNTGHFEEAIGYLEQASASDPKNALGWYLLGDSLRSASKSETTAGGRAQPRIAEAYLKCLQLDPEGPYAERAKIALKEMHAPVSAP